MLEPVSALVRRSLSLIADRQPRAYASIATALDGLTLSMTLGPDDRIHLTTVGHALHECDGDHADIRLFATRDSLSRLVDGDRTLVESIRCGAIDAYGTTGALRRAHDALALFVGALLRIEAATDLRRGLGAQDHV